MSCWKHAWNWTLALIRHHRDTLIVLLKGIDGNHSRLITVLISSLITFTQLDLPLSNILCLEICSSITWRLWVLRLPWYLLVWCSICYLWARLRVAMLRFLRISRSIACCIKCNSFALASFTLFWGTTLLPTRNRRLFAIWNLGRILRRLLLSLLTQRLLLLSQKCI